MDCSMVNNCKKSKENWLNTRTIPIAMIIVSVIQSFSFYLCTIKCIEKFRFDPNNSIEIWRYFTYMFLHVDWKHLLINIFIQCIFAIPLEMSQGRGKVSILYFLSGATAVFTASTIDYHHGIIIVGASAGGYSLLMANVADIFFENEKSKLKQYRGISIIIIIIIDIFYNVFYINDQNTSLLSHFIGAYSGLTLGLSLFECNNAKDESWSQLGLILFFSWLLSVLSAKMYFQKLIIN